ncbi:PilZ domain-containing protein [Granulosicoccus sp. 3-233]|uniref:PilZ domain-containing protein n=1 Tax=Granulosicoccus sp. 3-233 TaxID=3417969 RepID=UPI003D32637F
MAGDENRREGFRMDDLLKLQVKTVDKEDPEGIVADFDSYRIRTCLQSHLRNQKENRLSTLQSIRKRDSEIADYLEHLESQIAQLAARLSDDDDMELGDMQQETQVNMSASGLRFTTDLPDLVQGQLLELGMLLSTSGTEVVAVAEILRVEPAHEESPEEAGAALQISTRFTQIHPDDVEAIIRHMTKLQLVQLQARRNENDSRRPE